MSSTLRIDYFTILLLWAVLHMFLVIFSTHCCWEGELSCLKFHWRDRPGSHGFNQIVCESSLDFSWWEHGSPLTMQQLSCTYLVTYDPWPNKKRWAGLICFSLSREYYLINAVTKSFNSLLKWKECPEVYLWP